MNRHLRLERPLVWWTDKVPTDLLVDDLVMSTLVAPVFTFDHPERDELGKHIFAPRSHDYYILDHKAATEAPNVLAWAFFHRDISARRVALTDIGGGYSVSTVFLGMDHSFGLGSEDDGAILFESMVFDERGKDASTHRYHTWAEAEEGHAECVRFWSCADTRAAHEHDREQDTITSTSELLEDLDFI